MQSRVCGAEVVIDLPLVGYAVMQAAGTSSSGSEGRKSSRSSDLSGPPGIGKKLVNVSCVKRISIGNK